MLAVIFLALFAPIALGANILVMSPMPARSHNLLYVAIAKDLAKAGHKVTFYTGFPSNKPIPNLKEFKLPFTQDDLKSKLNLNLFDMRKFPALLTMVTMPQFGIVVSEGQLESKIMQDLLKSNEQFDLVIGTSFLAESINGLCAYKFKAPVVLLSPIQPTVWGNKLVGNIAPTSIIPNPILGFPPKMTFLQRTVNFLVETFAKLNYELYYLRKQQEIFAKYAGQGAPALIDILYNTSLILTNDHYSLSFPRPLVPQVISVGGLHVGRPNKLPEDLQKHLDGSKDGAILFSMGSNLKSSEMPQEKIDLILSAFSKLKQNVLWKFETDLPNKSKNVLISSWLPQSDILAHPNIKLFITHGGLLSTTESIDRGVPIVGIPIFGDQPVNMRQSVNAGVGVSLEYDDLTEESFLGAIREVLDNPRYREAAQERSRLFKDQQNPPMETARFWIEYVIRNKGAHHLKSPSVDLWWFQAEQLDVLAFLLVIVILTLYLVKSFFKCILSACCGKKESEKKKKKQ